MAEQFNPFIIFGASKSGTTWLQEILDAHPECRCHFQVPVFPLPSALFRKLHQPVTAVVNGKTSPYNGLFDTKEAEQQYLWRNAFLKKQAFLKSDYIGKLMKGHAENEIAFLKEFHKKILSSTVEQILKNNTSHLQRYGTKAYTDLDQLFQVFPQAKVISIVRDGRDVVVSKRFHTLRMGARMHGDERFLLHYWLNKIIPFRIAVNILNRKVNFMSDVFFRKMSDNKNLINHDVILKYASEWARTAQYIDEYHSKYPEQLKIVYYEKILSNPDKELKEIFKFLGLDYQAELIRQVIEKTAFEKKKKKGEQSFFRKGGSGDWKNYFKESDKKIFKKIAGDLLIKHRYEETDNW
jgi:stalled ribosome alternative rescue factor ArfA